MAMSPEQKAARARSRMLDTAKQYTTGTYSRRFVAPLFQRVIRAEAGADDASETQAIVDGAIAFVGRLVGECVCITCGKVLAWDSGIKGMHTGHFLAGRGFSILYEPSNSAPQCSHCNYYGHGEQKKFHQWMEAVHGSAEIERLQRLKAQSRQIDRFELVDMRIAFQERLNAAIQRIEGD